MEYLLTCIKQQVTMAHLWRAAAMGMVLWCLVMGLLVFKASTLTVLAC
jgi:hypothetical protein